MSTDVSSTASTGTVKPGSVDMGLEVVTLPVADVDRAKAFTAGLDGASTPTSCRRAFRVVQFTPPHSQCSIHFGIGLTSSAPGSVDRMILAVKDIDAARES